MTSKYLIILIVIFLALVILFPFALFLAGVPIFQSGSLSGGRGGSGTILLRSKDEGKNWDEVRMGENESFSREILDIAFHPRDHALLYLGTKSRGLWKSEDNGLSWVPVIDTSGILKQNADVYKIAFATSSPDVLYLAVFQDKRGRVLKSENRGESFREMLFVTADNFGVFDIYVNPRNADHVIAVTGQGGVLESANGGETWRIKRWFSEALAHILVNPDFPNEFFVITSSGKLWKTFDGGENWADLNKALRSAALKAAERKRFESPFFAFRSQGNIIEQLLPNPNIFSTLYLGSRAGLFSSTNGGFGWEQMNILIPPEALPVSAVAVHSSTTIFAAASNQVHRSDDGGRQWSVSIIDSPLRLSWLVIDPEDPKVMFAILK